MSSRFGVRISDVTDWKKGAAARNQSNAPVACKHIALFRLAYFILLSAAHIFAKWATPTNPLALSCFALRSLSLLADAASPPIDHQPVNDFVALGEQLVIGFTFVSWKTDFWFSAVINIAWHLSFLPAVTKVVSESHNDTTTQPETQPSRMVFFRGIRCMKNARPLDEWGICMSSH